MNQRPSTPPHWHTFQVLTKRAKRLEEIGSELDWPPNAWMGMSVEMRPYLRRIARLRRTGAQVKFISFEPLLGPLGDIEIADIHWAIVGWESGPKARPMDEGRLVQVRDQCLAAGVPFFFKQWGGINKKKAGRTLGGRTWDEVPRWRRAVSAF